MATNKKHSFEENLQTLEQLVSRLESGDLPLDQALAEFEKGIKLAKESQALLKAAEQKIKILLSESDDAALTDFLSPEADSLSSNKVDDDDVPF